MFDVADLPITFALPLITHTPPQLLINKVFTSSSTPAFFSILGSNINLSN